MCLSPVQRDLGGADDWTITSQSEYGGKNNIVCVFLHTLSVCVSTLLYLCVVCTDVYLCVPSPGPSSDSDLTSLAVDIDSLAELDDGMASGRSSPNQPLGGSSTITSTHSSPSLPPLYDYQQHHHQQHTSNPAPGSPAPEVSRTSRTALFPSSLRRGNANARETKRDYLDRASEHIRLAVQKEAEQDYQSAFSYYRSGVDLLLQGVQGKVPWRKTLGTLLRRQYVCLFVVLC